MIWKCLLNKQFCSAEFVSQKAWGILFSTICHQPNMTAFSHTKNRAATEQQHLTCYRCLIVPLASGGAVWEARPTSNMRMILQSRGSEHFCRNILNSVSSQLLLQLCFKRLRLSSELFLLFVRRGASERGPNHSFCSHCWQPQQPVLAPWNERLTGNQNVVFVDIHSEGEYDDGDN